MLLFAAARGCYTDANDYTTEGRYMPGAHISRLKTLFLFGSVLVLVSSGLFGLYVAPLAAECQPFPTQSQVTLNVSVPSSGDYQVWLRQMSPAEGNSIFLKVNEECPLIVAKNQNPNQFEWVSKHEPNQPLVLNLAAGTQKLVLAGNQTDIKVDKILFTADRSCVPEGNGDNCLQIKPPVEGPPQEQIQARALDLSLMGRDLSFGSTRAPWIWLIIGAIIGLLITLGFVLWHYHGFIRRVILPKAAQRLPDHSLPQAKHITRNAFKLETVRLFLKHHKILVIASGVIVALLVALLTIGIVNADNRPVFEVEDGTLSGEATVVTVNGTKAVNLGKKPVGTTNGSPVNPGNGGAPDPQPGNGGGVVIPPPPGDEQPQPGECPPWPQFPDENCTGWQHTGVTLHECETDNGYIWDSNVSFDSCYFPQSLTIYGSNIKITRSQVHGTITPHWSRNYSMGGLTLIDVEIEQTGVEDINSAALSGNNYTCKRCNIHHTLSGIHFGDNTRIEDSYTHDFQWRDEAHGAGIGTGQDHGSNSFIIHNNIQCNRISGPPICSSALSIYPEDDNGDGITIHDVQVEKNLFNATGAYCVYAVNIPGSNINFKKNYFGKKFYPYCAGYGPVTSYGSDGGVWEENIWADGSGDVDPFKSYY